jgi:hypothetical protein
MVFAERFCWLLGAGAPWETGVEKYWLLRCSHILERSTIPLKVRDLRCSHETAAWVESRVAELPVLSPRTITEMTSLRTVLLGLAFVCSNACALQQTQPAGPPAAEAIMTRVGANQDRAEADRLHYVYLQHAHIISRNGKTVMCEEVTDARVAPSDSGSSQELLKLDGRVLRKHRYVTYTTPLSKHDRDTNMQTDDDSISITVGDKETDRGLVENMRANLTNDKSKDGLGARLFPLTTRSQSDYVFHLLGREHINGRDVFHVGFVPKDKDSFGWKGDAYIDASAYQPVVVKTAMSRKIPFAVRTLLGTSLPGLGFTVVYAPQPDGVWFPVSFGTEFKLHVLFFFTREFIIDAQNSDFEKTHVSSKIIGDGDPVPPQLP